MIFPAIDLMDGGCVRLLKGDFDQRTNYDISPIEMARQFAEMGAEWMHVKFNICWTAGLNGL